jgi:hypothetical protein
MAAFPELAGAIAPVPRSAPSIEHIGGVALLGPSDFYLAAQELALAESFSTLIWNSLVRHQVLRDQRLPGIDPSVPESSTAALRLRQLQEERAKPWPIVFTAMPDLNDGKRHGIGEFGGLRADTLADYVQMLHSRMHSGGTPDAKARILAKHTVRGIRAGGFRLLEKVVEMNPVSK